MAISVQPLAGSIGAEVHGVDLTQTVSDADFAAIHDALVTHLVIFFRDQDLTPAQHVALAKRFGPTQCHPAYPHVDGFPELTILESTVENPSKIEKWHTDMTFRKNPPLGSLLHGQVIPEKGGDTMWASMQAAYEGLSDRWQQFVSGLTARHDFAYGFKESLAEEGGYERLKTAIADNPTVQHPVVRTHPVTGRKGLFVNCLFTLDIVDMSEPESRAVLEFLYEHCVQPEYTCRFRWEKHSLAIWDNRATQHRPINDFLPQPRMLRRVVVDGDIPY